MLRKRTLRKVVDARKAVNTANATLASVQAADSTVLHIKEIHAVTKAEAKYKKALKTYTRQKAISHFWGRLLKRKPKREPGKKQESITQKTENMHFRITNSITHATREIERLQPRIDGLQKDPEPTPSVKTTIADLKTQKETMVQLGKNATKAKTLLRGTAIGQTISFRSSTTTTTGKLIGVNLNQGKIFVQESGKTKATHIAIRRIIKRVA